MSSSIRLHVAAALATGAQVALGAAPAHYLRHVMRRAAGDRVLLFNGSDGEWQARLIAIDRAGARLDVTAQTRPQSAGPDCWLLFAPLKRDATDLVARQATELGVAALRPVMTERTVAVRVNAARLAAIATEAAEQSERLTVPDVAGTAPLAEALAAWPAGRRLYVALEREDAPPPDGAPAGPSALLVGPEGGFSPTERALLLRHPAVRPVSLGRFVLRAETAVAAGLALLLMRPPAPPLCAGGHAS